MKSSEPTRILTFNSITVIVNWLASVLHPSPYEIFSSVDLPTCSLCISFTAIVVHDQYTCTLKRNFYGVLDVSYCSSSNMHVVKYS